MIRFENSPGRTKAIYTRNDCSEVSLSEVPNLPPLDLYSASTLQSLTLILIIDAHIAIRVNNSNASNVHQRLCLFLLFPVKMLNHRVTSAPIEEQPHVHPCGSSICLCTLSHESLIRFQCCYRCCLSSDPRRPGVWRC